MASVLIAITGIYCLEIGPFSTVTAHTDNFPQSHPQYLLHICLKMALEPICPPQAQICACSVWIAKISDDSW